MSFFAKRAAPEENSKPDRFQLTAVLSCALAAVLIVSGIVIVFGFLFFV